MTCISHRDMIFIKMGQEALARLCDYETASQSNKTKWGEAEDAETIEAEQLALGKPDGC